MLLWLLIGVTLLELSLYSRLLWRWHRALVYPLTAGLAFLSGYLLISRWSLVAGLVCLVNSFRLLNLFRIAKRRMHEHYLRRVAYRTGLWLGVMTLVLVVLLWRQLGNFNAHQLLIVLVISQTFVALTLFLSTLRNLQKTRHLSVLEHYADRELPTVTVAIPARNETADLEECLRTILASDYPKLEVLVLDDCSQDKTAELIRSFAHDGVRFIQGKEPKERWLAKNQAYDALAKSASGELILFCGVDVRFGAHAIRSLVTTLLNRKKTMISVMPRRLTGTPIAAFIQPMRYWWELALPRRLFNRPAVLSTCWLIRRKTLTKLGGFGAVSHAIIPEGYFARSLVKTDDYSFIRADELLDIQTTKRLVDQRYTAVRMRYPQVRRRPENVLLLSLAEVVFFLLPFGLLVINFWWPLDWLIWPVLISTVLLITTHILIVSVSNPINIPTALFNFPLVVLTELYLGYESMLKYEFSVVEWKGRNVCIPVMHVIPKLPPLSNKPSSG